MKNIWQDKITRNIGNKNKEILSVQYELQEYSIPITWSDFRLKVSCKSSISIKNGRDIEK